MTLARPAPRPATGRGDPMRRAALVAGLLYLLTFASSIPAVALLGPVLTDPDYITGGGSDPLVIAGCLLDVLNALACIGTAVVLFPVVKRQHEGLALGFVASRMLEAAVILIGVVCLLAVVALRQHPPADPAGLPAVGAALVAVRDRTFLLGPSLMPAFNALLLGTLLFRARLVPRAIPLIGLIGAPLLLASDLAQAFGLTDQGMPITAVAALPIFLWELGLGLWLTFKGLDPSRLPARG